MIKCTWRQCVAVCCSVLQRVAVWCSVVQCVAVWCGTIADRSVLYFRKDRLQIRHIHGGGGYSVTLHDMVFLLYLSNQVTILGIKMKFANEHSGQSALLQCVAVCCIIMSYSTTDYNTNIAILTINLLHL